VRTEGTNIVRTSINTTRRGATGWALIYAKDTRPPIGKRLLRVTAALPSVGLTTKIVLAAKVAATLLFFAAMAYLTLNARNIHNSQIPHVETTRLTREKVSADVRVLALPKELYDSGDVYVIAQRMINGEVRSVAKKAVLQVGAAGNGFYEVKGGLMGNEIVVTSSDKPLSDGAEVFVIPKDSR
jgi:hypothetical protein